MFTKIQRKWQGDFGDMAMDSKIGTLFQNTPLHVELDEFVIIPNHVHGILTIVGIVGVNNYSPLPLIREEIRRAVHTDL